MICGLIAGPTRRNQGGARPRRGRLPLSAFSLPMPCSGDGSLPLSRQDAAIYLENDCWNPTLAGGRAAATSRPVFFSFCPAALFFMSHADEAPVWVGFDLGGTKMLAVVYDDSETPQPLGRKRRKTKGSAGSDSGVERICTTIERALEEAKIDLARLAGIGIGCPGPVDPLKG